MSYRDGVLLMGDIHKNPPVHHLLAIKYGYYEARKKAEKQKEGVDLIEQRRWQNRGGGTTFDNLPAHVQERRMQRVKAQQAAEKAKQTKNG